MPEGHISRRDFIKIAAASVGSLAGSFAFDYLSGVAKDISAKSDILIPATVDGVDVYGSNSPLKSVEDVKFLYDFFDQVFDKELTSEEQGMPRDAQRDLLPSNERYVEFVTTRSTYNSFENKRSETGVSLPMWAKLHTDLMTAIVKNGRPSVDLSIKALRVVILDDNFKTNPSRYSKDMDASWFIDTDYRYANTGGYLYRAGISNTKNLELTALAPNLQETGYKISISSPGGIYNKLTRDAIIDMGIIHELSHLALNLPDEYALDVYGSDLPFPEFKINTGSLMIPEISPYLSMLIHENVTSNIRGYYTDPKGIGVCDSSEMYHYSRVPRTVAFRSNGDTQMWIQRTEFEAPDYYFNKGRPRKFGKAYELKRFDNRGLLVPTHQLMPQILEGNKTMYSNVFCLKTQVDGEVKTLYIPRAIFNMTSFSGKSEAIYKIDFLKSASEGKKLQKLSFKYSDQMPSYLKECFEKSNPPYAIMPVDGTDAVCVWTLE